MKEKRKVRTDFKIGNKTKHKNIGYHKVNNKKGKNEKFISKNGVKRLRGSEKTQKCLK